MFLSLILLKNWWNFFFFFKEIILNSHTSGFWMKKSFTFGLTLYVEIKILHGHEENILCFREPLMKVPWFLRFSAVNPNLLFWESLFINHSAPEIWFHVMSYFHRIQNTSERTSCVLLVTYSFIVLDPLITWLRADLTCWSNQRLMALPLSSQQHCNC